MISRRSVARPDRASWLALFVTLAAAGCSPTALGAPDGDPAVADADTDGGPAAADAAAREATEEAARELLRQYHEDVWEQGRLDHIANYLGPGFVSHARPVRLPDGSVAGQDLLYRLRMAFPDMTSHADAILADGDRAVIQWTIRGTQTGALYGIAPTGRAVEFSGMDVLRVADGKFVEHWGGINDQMEAVFAQLASP